MAKKYDNTNQGVAFKNKERRDDKDPHMRGQINVDGKDYWLSVWKNEHDEHGTYLKMAVQPKEAQEKAKPSQKKAPAAKPALDDDLDF